MMAMIKPIGGLNKNCPLPYRYYYRSGVVFSKILAFLLITVPYGIYLTYTVFNNHSPLIRLNNVIAVDLISR